MKLDKIIIVLVLLMMAGSSVWADTTTPVVTERKKIEKPIIPNENVQKTTPQKPVVPDVQVPKAKPSTTINNQYSKPKMGITIYTKNKPTNTRSSKQVCNKCKYPKRTRSFWVNDNLKK